MVPPVFRLSRRPLRRLESVLFQGDYACRWISISNLSGDVTENLYAYVHDARL